jgi:hypothetical protein
VSRHSLLKILRRSLGWPRAWQQSPGAPAGNPWLRRTLAEVANVANVAGRTKGAYLATQFRHIAPRRGKWRAVIAVGHSVLVAKYMLTRKEPYHELGAQYFDEYQRDHVH